MGRARAMSARRPGTPPGQLGLFTAVEPVKRRSKVPYAHTPDELAAFERLNGVLLTIRPDWLASDERLCQGGCGKVIGVQTRTCGRRWCDAVRPTWGRTVGEVIRAALSAYVDLHAGSGRVLTTALTCRHEEGWWDTDKCGHPTDGSACSGPAGCRVKPAIEERERELWPARKRAAVKMARAEAIRKLKRAGYPVDREALRTLNVLISVTEDQSRGLPTSTSSPAIRPRSRSPLHARSLMLSLVQRVDTGSASPTATTTRSQTRASTRPAAFTATSQSWRATWLKARARPSSCCATTASECSTSRRGSRSSPV